jgi:hypothetical protein
MRTQQLLIKKSNQVCYSLPYSGEGRAPWPNGYFRVLIGNTIQFVKESNLTKVANPPLIPSLKC